MRWGYRKQYVIGMDKVERAASKRRASPVSYSIGIDEVGRGSLAGPVYVAAVAVPRRLLVGRILVNGRNIPLRDSKKLSARQREAWFEYVKRVPHILCATASIGSKTIDKINITQAANLAATRAYAKLIDKLPATSDMKKARIRVLLDGGLYLNRATLKNSKLHTPNPSRYTLSTIIKGDEKYLAIALASIAAKVSRDRYMCRLSKKYPGYGFEVHKGYGTRRHRLAISNLGSSEVHRRSFTLV